MWHITKWNAFEKTLSKSRLFVRFRCRSRDVNNNGILRLVVGVVITRRVEVAYGTSEHQSSVPSFVSEPACCEKTLVFHPKEVFFLDFDDGTGFRASTSTRCANFKPLRAWEVDENRHRTTEYFNMQYYLCM